jgi:hypothetical protein
MFKHGFELPHRADPFAAREFVDFRRDDRPVLDNRSQPSPGLDVIGQAWMPRVN